MNDYAPLVQRPSRLRRRFKLDRRQQNRNRHSVIIQADGRPNVGRCCLDRASVAGAALIQIAASYADDPHVSS